MWRASGLLCVVAWVLLGVRCQWMYEDEMPNKEEHEECNRQNGRVWLCKKDTECPASRYILQRGGRLSTCSWKDANTHIVCCPPGQPPKPVTKSISETKCAEFQSLLCENSQYRGPSNQIVSEVLNRRKRQRGNDFAIAAIGGENARPREHPHMALIGYDVEDAISWECGGSLISERFVLSAAHCSDTPYGPARWARLGDLDITISTDDAKPQQFQIVERMVHDDYSPTTFYNDIVLFRLDREAVFDRYVGPACLYTSLADPPGFGIATGWGRNESHGPKSAALVKVDLRFIDTEVCKENVGTIRNVLPKGLDTQTMLCAGEPGKDTCQGDSGGPLVLKDTGGQCLAHQVGITSFGPKFCGMSKVTGAYVRVAYFVPWIESIVWPPS